MVAQEEVKEIEKLFDRLFPICRSITGPGLRETLDILSKYMPLEHFAVKTGTKVLNWVIPEEWRIYDAWLKGPDGEKIVDFKDNNLHILNYSTPIDKEIELNELKEHLHTVPHLPDAIPYVTSYYKRRWGFCLPHNKYTELKPGKYHAYINSELVNGELNYGHAILPGESDKEILISTYICHPSMANNELSGPIVATFLYNRIAKWKKRNFTYRFVFVPETIGSIAYLDRFGDKIKERIYSGLVLTCVGGKANLNYKLSRQEEAPIDKIIKHLFEYSEIEGSMRPFTPIFGSDERHYCSPGFNLPMGQMARLVYGYPQYHTSADDKGLMTIESLYNSINEVELILKALELDGYYINNYPYGEIKLDQHGLYPDINSRQYSNQFKDKVIQNRHQLNQLLTVLNYSDGVHSMREIVEKFNNITRRNDSILDFKFIIDILKEKGLLKGPYFKEEVKPIWK
jgi:aminopeptidase-like protein